MPDLDSLADDCWTALSIGAADRAHAFHTGVLATTSSDGADARTVVLRLADPDSRALWFHTDRRSEKVPQLAAQPVVSWVFWDPVQQVQLRCRCRANLNARDEDIAEHWALLHAGARVPYEQAQPPGSPITGHDLGPDPLDRQVAPESFLPVRCTVFALDWLSLARSGHQRAKLDWDGSRWRPVAVAP